MLSPSAGCVIFPGSKEVYKLKPNKHNLRISLGGQVEEVGQVVLAYIPTDKEEEYVLEQDVYPGKKISRNSWNAGNRIPVVNNQKDWAGRNVPKYVVLIKEEIVSRKNSRHAHLVYKGATVYLWRPGVVTLEGRPLDWDFPIVGALTGEVVDGVYSFDETITRYIEVNPYTGDRFNVTTKGHYFSYDDGYLVPKNFAEFYAKEPRYIRRWTSKWLKLPEDNEAVRDWEQELLLYLHYLPENSKARKPSSRHPDGCTDVIQCFDPYRQYGASERRFRNYLNICLYNRSVTIIGKQNKNPVYRKDNVIFGMGNSSDEDVYIADDEYIHSHSRVLEKKSEDQCTNMEKHLLVKRFYDYVWENQPELISTLNAISETGTIREAKEMLGVDEATFTRNKKRLIQLRESFIDGGPIQKQRKPYKTREKVEKSFTGNTSQNEYF